MRISPQANDISGICRFNIFLGTNGLALCTTAGSGPNASGGRLKAISCFLNVGQYNGLVNDVIRSNQVLIFKVGHLWREPNDNYGTTELRAELVALQTKIHHREGLGNGLSYCGPLAAGIRLSSPRATTPKSSIAVPDKKCIHSVGMLNQNKRRVMTSAIV